MPCWLTEEDSDFDEDDVVQCVDRATLLGLKQYYDKDPDIQICKRRKIHETFRADWSVGLWDEKQEREVKRLAHLDTPRYKKLLRDFLTRAHDYLVLFQFVGYYCVKDMTAWYERMRLREARARAIEAGALEETSSEADEEDDEPLPFGVIDLGLNLSDGYGTFKMVQRAGSVQRRLYFTCNDEVLAERYNFYVFDNGATFETLMEPRRLNDREADLAVLTPFMDLYNKRLEVEEARICLFDANFQSTHPESFVVAKPLPEQRVDQMPEPVRWGKDTMTQAGLENSMRRVELTTALAQDQLNVLKQQSRQGPRTASLEGTGIDTMGAESLYSARRCRFQRPDLKESLKVLPESMDLARGPAPTPLVVLGELQQRYELEICSAMGFPHSFLRVGGGDGGGGGGQQKAAQESNKNEARLVFAQKEMEEQTEKQQEVFQSLFSEIYKRTFGRLSRGIRQETGGAKQRGAPRLNFANISSKTDQAVIALLPLMLAGVLGDDEYRAMVARNYRGLVEEEEKPQARNERKKRLEAATMPKEKEGEKKPAKKAKKKEKKAKKASASSNNNNSKKTEKSGEKPKKKKASSSSGSKEEKKEKKEKDSSSSGNKEEKEKKSKDSSSESSEEKKEEEKKKRKKDSSSSSSSESTKAKKKKSKKTAH